MARPRKEIATGDNYVWSTLANSQMYTTYNVQEGIPPVPVHEFLIRGGAAVAVDLGNGAAGETPQGVVTIVPDADLEMLLKCPAFVEHQKRGYLFVVKKMTDAEVAVADMSRDDPSAPLTPTDMTAAGATVSEDGATITLPTVETQ